MSIVLSVTAVPEVDLRHPAGQLRTRLCEVARQVGFFYLTGHEVPESLTRRAPPDVAAAHGYVTGSAGVVTPDR